LKLAEAQAKELHACHVGEHGGQLALNDLETGERFAKLDALLGIGGGNFVSCYGVTNRLPGYT
jgi:hypothetical protein